MSDPLNHHAPKRRRLAGPLLTLLLALGLAALWKLSGQTQGTPSAANGGETQTPGEPEPTPPAELSGTTETLVSPTREAVPEHAQPSPAEKAPVSLVSQVTVLARSGLGDLPLGPVQVRVLGTKRPKIDRVIRIDGTGQGQIAVLPGTYQFSLVASSLPLGILVAPHPAGSGRTNSPKWEDPELEVETPGQPHQVTVRGFPSGRVYGRILGPDGKGIPGAPVRASNLDCNNRFSRDQVSGEDGAYAFDLYPAQYRIAVWNPTRSETLGQFTVRPAPIDLEVLPGTAIEQDFVIAGGPCTLMGQFVNPARLPGEESEVWSQIPVVLLPSQTPENVALGRPKYLLNDNVAGGTTDSEGGFEIGGLEPGTYRIAAYSIDGYSPRSRTCNFAQWPQYLEVILRTPGETRLDPIPVERARPCTVRGQVLSDLEKTKRWKVRVWYANGSAPNRDVYSVDLDTQDGRFETFIHTIPGLTSTRVQVFEEASQEPLLTQPFEAIPNGEVELRLRVP